MPDCRMGRRQKPRQKPPSARPRLRGPQSWGGVGPRMGFFFGGDAMRAGIYRVIAERLAPSMPAFGETLSCGQIWALFAHIEDF